MRCFVNAFVLIAALVVATTQTTASLLRTEPDGEQQRQLMTVGGNAVELGAYIGCFLDNEDDRALINGYGNKRLLYDPVNMDLEVDGWNYNGRTLGWHGQWERDDKRFDRHGQVTNSVCQTPCPGNPDEFCGSENAFRLYYVGKQGYPGTVSGFWHIIDHNPQGTSQPIDP